MDSLYYGKKLPLTLEGNEGNSFIRSKNLNKDNQGYYYNIEFQILDWRSCHEEDMDGNKRFIIRLFGRTRDNKTIFVKINKYTPYFYVQINKSWRQLQIDALMKTVQNMVYPKQNVDGLVKSQIASKYSFWGFTNYEKFNFLQLWFSNYDAMRSYINVFKKPLNIREISGSKIKLQLFESNIEPFLRFMHIRDLDAVGWVKILSDKYEFQKSKSTHCDINIETDWTSLNKITDISIVPFTIASFDIECTSSDGSFPQANRDGDKIIQIGTTFSRLGEDEVYFQHIVTLGSCDPIPNVTVESYEKEEEVLLAWTRLLQRTNPDIITGYNIFGFDFKYMKDRSQKLGISERFSRLSRINNEMTPFVQKQLSSAALGSNLLEYFDMNGRVLIDLMKVIQRDHKLEGWKLDFVASHFIKEEIIEIIPDGDNTIIKTKSIYGLKENQYITISYYDGISNNKHMDDKKFKVLKLSNLSDKEILVNDKVDISIMDKTKGYKVFWCQAKDDISPKDIFRLQEGSSKDRSIIAKYCLQDCILCNKLIAKLQVLINNIGMANVCNVPLSYLFMRGQGVKIFSLVSKACRKKDHLIPVFVKKFKTKEEKLLEKDKDKEFEKFIAKLNRIDNDDDEEEDNSYEGAIVFDPIVGVHYEPIPVLDYSSLYPKSMIHKNLSHECYVINDEKYGNLPGYKYHEIEYVTNKINEPYERYKLKSLLDPFKDEKKYVIEELNTLNTTEKLRKHYKIYDRDHNNNKRWLVSEIKVDNTEIHIINYETSKFAEKKDGTKGIVPEILSELLNARSNIKKAMESEKDPFKKSIFDGLQNAYKITANSLYGQTGSSFSAICMKQIAASTTATGRNQLIFSRNFIENIYGKLINLALENKEQYLKYCRDLFVDVPPKRWIRLNEKNKEEEWLSYNEFCEKFYTKMNIILKDKYVNPKVIYGDTDSTFFKMNIIDKRTGEIGKDRKALEISIQLGIWASHAICLLLPFPQEMVYEKVLWPFMILTKKRYVGNLYEKDPNKFYQKSMGIVLKRRDNAQIVKIACGGIVDQILNKHNPAGAIEFTKKVLKDILSSKFPMDKFVITKTLKGNGLTKKEQLTESLKSKEDRIYVDRSRIVHAVLADRMTERDPGNKPLSNDRIPYVYVITKGNVELQGDRVETPEYVIANKLKLDYLFYITNQIQKPAIQFLGLIAKNPEYIFEEYIIREQNRRSGKKPIKTFFANERDDNEISENVLNIDNFTNINIEPVKKRIRRKKQKNQIEQKINIDESFTLNL